MSAKHTPGPWKYGKRKDGSLWLSLGDPTAGPHWQADLHASEGDARLIAASPRLLGALTELVAEAETAAMLLRKGHDVSSLAARIDDARAAIAEAEGKK